MEARSKQGHATRSQIPPRPEDRPRAPSSSHTRKHSESSTSSSTSSHGPATPPSPYFPTPNYCGVLSRDGGSWAYDLMDAESGYEYLGGGGYYGQGESSDAAGLQPTDGYCCLVPGCKAVPFKRNADLDRHYKHKHRPDETKESYYCDYPKCSRRDSPFHRRDHFRDHLREYHKEDIAKRGRPVRTHWVKEKAGKREKEWWRCTRCLKRVMVERDGWECPGCKASCEVGRVQGESPEV